MTHQHPQLASVTAITTPDNDTTPSFVFSSNEAGTITSSLAFHQQPLRLMEITRLLLVVLAMEFIMDETVTVTDASQ